MSFTESASLWVAAFLLLAVSLWRLRGASVGLSASYLVGLALIHVPGALVYADGRYWYFDPEWVREGFAASAVGALSFAIGALGCVLWSRAPAPSLFPAILYSSKLQTMSFRLCSESNRAVNPMVLNMLCLSAASHRNVDDIFAGLQNRHLKFESSSQFV